MKRIPVRGTALGLGVLLLLLAAGCGGGGGGGDDANVLSGLSTSVGSLDGWVRTDGAVNAGEFPRVGDFDGSAPGLYMLAGYTFEVGAIAPGSEIRGATLTVQGIGNDGNPYLQHGDMQVHFVPYGNDLANVLTVAVMNPPPPAYFSPSTVAVGGKEADVRALLQFAIERGDTRLQVSVGFMGPAMPDNSQDDYVMLSDGEGSVPGYPAPTLTFQWVEP